MQTTQGLRGQSVKRRKSRILLEPNVSAAYSKITSIEHERNSSKNTEIKSVQDLRNPKITINNCAEIRILGSEEIVCSAPKESKMIFGPLRWMKVLKSKSKHNSSNENKRKSTIWPKWLKVTRKTNSSKAKKSTANQEQYGVILKEEENKTLPVKNESISKDLNISQLSKLSKVNFITQKKVIKSKFMCFKLQIIYNFRSAKYICRFAQTYVDISRVVKFDAIFMSYFRKAVAGYSF